MLMLGEKMVIWIIKMSKIVACSISKWIKWNKTKNHKYNKIHNNNNNTNDTNNQGKVGCFCIMTIMGD